MDFDWPDYLKLSKFLADSDLTDICGQEAALRSSVSRAYFAAFCHARKFALRNGYIVADDNKVHSEIRNWFRKKYRHWPQIPDDLNELRKWRNDCDYENVVHNLAELAAESIEQAENIINTLK